MSRGFDLKMGLPEIRDVGAGEEEALEYDLETLFRTTGGEVVRVALRVTQGSLGLGMLSSPTERPARAGYEATPDALAVEASPAPAEAPEQKSVDEVLF